MTREQTLAFYTAEAATIRHTAGLCLKRVPLQQRLRLLGVRVGSLTKADGIGDIEPNRPLAPAEHAQAASYLIATTGQLF